MLMQSCHVTRKKDLARVVRKVDIAIHRINHYPADSLTRDDIECSPKGIYNAWRPYQIVEGGKLNMTIFLCFQAFNLAPKIGRSRQATCSSLFECP